MYDIAFLQNDATGMAQQVAWGAGKPGVEDVLLASEADTAGYFGRLAKARELSRRAVASAQHAEEKEAAAGYEGDAAVREVLFGNSAEARHRAAAALTLSNGRDVQYGAALRWPWQGICPGLRPSRMTWPSGFRQIRSCCSTTCQRFALCSR